MASIAPKAGQSQSQPQPQPRRFAPLDPNAKQGQEHPRLRGIVFDVDGTLWYVIPD
jgi:hypothetical protein